MSLLAFFPLSGTGMNPARQPNPSLVGSKVVFVNSTVIYLDNGYFGSPEPRNLSRRALGRLLLGASEC